MGTCLKRHLYGSKCDFQSGVSWAYWRQRQETPQKGTLDPLKSDGSRRGRTPKRHAHDMRAAPAEVIHQRQRVGRHEMRAVRCVALRDAAVADAPVVKCAAPVSASHRF